MKPIYFVNNYKTRHIMSCKSYELLRDAKSAAKELASLNDGSAIVRQDSEGTNNLVWHSSDVAKYYANECTVMGKKAP